MKKIMLACALAAVMGAHQIASANTPNMGYTFADPVVKNFSALACGGSIQVIVTLGNTESLHFEGDAEAIATLVSEVQGKTLIIRPKTSWTSWAHKYKNKQIIAHVTAKNIVSLTMSGDGSITVKGNLRTSNLTTTLSGSGSIHAQIDVQNLTAVISGSGKLNIAGDADKASITISGSGVLADVGLGVETLNTTIAGSGRIYVDCDGDINATILGSGNVYYRGHADVNKKGLGSGSVQQIK